MRRERVVVLGGGMAALTAAFELSRPGWRDRYESITVYQVGWRLGGKGASGRHVHGRIEEHGLHLWLGFYENAFRLLQDCYAELKRPDHVPLARWDQAFEKASFVVLQERHQGEWTHWPIGYPEDDDVPGSGGPARTLWDCVTRAIELAASLAGVGRSVSREAHGPDTAGPHELLAWLDTIADAWPDRSDRRRLRSLFDLLVANVRGILAEGLLTHPEGLAAIDHLDYCEWLRGHGASAEALESPVLRGAYALAFAYRDGDPAQPALAAGRAVQSLARFFFGYKGAIFWRMRAGMGDVVFAPLYEVLRARGVEFRFFHRVETLRLSGDGRTVAAVELARQVNLVDEAAGYDPLVVVRDVPSWPAEPRWEQIVGGERLAGRNPESFWRPWPDVGEVSLRAGVDFDRLVFGISLGAVPYLCGELIARSARWRAMVDHVATVQTQAFQVWLSRSVTALGWPFAQATVSSYVHPFDTYADMRQLIEREDWPDAIHPEAIGYFCNVMPTARGLRRPPDPAFADGETAKVKANAIDFLRLHAAHLWPRLASTTGFRWELLTGATSSGVEGFDSQYWRANVDPSERYVLSLPGTNRFRIRPGQTGFDNLYIAGDWTDCGLNVGCVEAAVMSGMLASHAISGRPALDDIVGHDAG